MTLRARRILVAEADAEVRSVIEDLLIDHGFEIHLAGNADDSALALRRDAFEVLLCHLPLLRAREGRLCQLVRELQPACRIVAMSASGAKARADEADTNLPKPFTRSQLLAAFAPAQDGSPGAESRTSRTLLNNE